MGLVNVDRRYSGDTIAIYIWNMGSDNGGDSVDFCGWFTLYACPSGWGFLVGLIWLDGNASRGRDDCKIAVGTGFIDHGANYLFSSTRRIWVGKKLENVL